MDDYKELIERLRYEGYDVSRNEAANAIESLLVENERLKHNLAVTEQTIREYQEIAAKRLEEIAKYRDAPVVAYQHRDGMLSCRLPGGGVPGIDWALLIVKPGEEK